MDNTTNLYDVIVVGAGFAGIYALWQAKKRGYKVKGFERAPDVGGTWYHNAYPGARCDVESYNYAYYFSDEIVRDWSWSETCAGQEEIQRYLKYVANHCKVLDHITFNCKILSAKYDEISSLWTLTTTNNESFRCSYPIFAIGALSEPKKPDIPGVESFTGESYFTSSWPKHQSIEFTNKRVGVIGTGSSGVQCIPEIAKTAKTTYVFQRTANYVTPTLSGPMIPSKVAKLRENPQEVRRAFRETYGGHIPIQVGESRFFDLSEKQREESLETAWKGVYIPLAFRDAHLPEANNAISDFIRKKMLEQVKDKWTAEHLVPWDHPYGGKRPCLSNTYLQSFNQSNVHLVCLKETPITEIQSRGIKTSEKFIPLDTIVFATGFDAISGPLFAINIRGLNNKSLKNLWSDGPVNYLGTMVNGFPNLFLPSSAMSPSVLSNMATLAEQQVDFIFDKIDWLEAHGKSQLHPKEESQKYWQEETLRYAHKRPGALSTKSWYSGANIPGKPRVFMVYCGGFKRYHEKCYEELTNNFPGYEFFKRPTQSAQVD